VIILTALCAVVIIINTISLSTQPARIRAKKQALKLVNEELKIIFLVSLKDNIL
jgi:hypothetical protein